MAATSATEPPMSASVQRRKAPWAPGSSAATTMDWTAAWVTKRMPASSSSAVDIARKTIRPSCHAPEPMPATSTSATKTPIATPMVTSATRRSRCPYDVPRETTAAMGAKNGWSCPTRSAATNQATAAAIAHCSTTQRLDFQRAMRPRSDRRLRDHIRSSDASTEARLVRGQTTLVGSTRFETAATMSS